MPKLFSTAPTLLLEDQIPLILQITAATITVAAINVAMARKAVAVAVAKAAAVVAVAAGAKVENNTGRLT